jgi:Ca2+-binding RTX toxin-like protein
VIGVAAVGVMALGAQTAAQTQAPTPPGQAPPTCKGLAATIVGTEGPDANSGSGADFIRGQLIGTPGRDVIVALGGDDFDVYGGAGNDVICGGPGKDKLNGGAGKDTLLGQAGSDLLDGDGGNRADQPGKDRCEGGKGHDFTIPWHSWPKGPSLPVVSKSRTTCEVEKSIEKSGFRGLWKPGGIVF